MTPNLESCGSDALFVGANDPSGLPILKAHSSMGARHEEPNGSPVLQR